MSSDAGLIQQPSRQIITIADNNDSSCNQYLSIWILTVFQWITYTTPICQCWQCCQHVGGKSTLGGWGSGEVKGWEDLLGALLMWLWRLENLFRDVKNLLAACAYLSPSWLLVTALPKSMTDVCWPLLAAGAAVSEIESRIMCSSVQVEMSCLNGTWDSDLKYHQHESTEIVMRLRSTCGCV